MSDKENNKVIIVEGLTDKKQLEKVINENITILTTHGTFSIERFDEMLDEYNLDDREVYILVDEDRAGIQLRKQLNRELSHAKQLYISEEFKEVASTPETVLANLLLNNYFDVHSHYL